MHVNVALKWVIFERHVSIEISHSTRASDHPKNLTETKIHLNGYWPNDHWLIEIAKLCPHFELRKILLENETYVEIFAARFG